MTAWPGGECPDCGEYMPAKLIHCRTCRALLNEDLVADSVVIPEFVPLQEISAMVDVKARGYYVRCPKCKRELRISRKYVGQNVVCKHCETKFLLDLSAGDVKTNAFYATCPHCDQELRASPKYAGENVACKRCSGQIHFVEATA